MQCLVFELEGGRPSKFESRGYIMGLCKNGRMWDIVGIRRVSRFSPFQLHLVLRY